MNENKDNKNNLPQNMQEDTGTAETEQPDSTVLSDEEMEEVVGGYAPPRSHPSRRLNIKKNNGCI